MGKRKIFASLKKPAAASSTTRSPDPSAPMVVSAELVAALYEILDATILLMDGDLGNIQLYDPECNTLEIVAQRGFPAEFMKALGRVSIDDPRSSPLVPHPSRLGDPHA